ncbi:MAG: transporter substrate-binding domain-containing protein [Armatimonadota bacterium]
MSNRLFIFLTILFICLNSSISAQTLPEKKVDYERIYLIGCEEDWHPFEYIDSKGNPAGFNVDLTLALAEVMDFEVKIVPGTWNELFNKFNENKLDFLSGTFITEERKKIYNFSEPVFVISQSIFVRKDNDDIKSLDDLDGKKIIVQKSVAHIKTLTDMGFGDNLILVDTEPDAIRLLASGKHDCAIISRISGLIYIKQHRITNLKTVGKSVFQYEYAYIVKKDNIDTLEKINEGLRILRQTGEYERIYNKWFGLIDTEGKLQSVFIARYFAYIIIPLLILLFIILLWSWTLRKQVAIKTRDLTNELAERKRAEYALIKAEEKIRSIFENSALGVFQSELDGSKIIVNKAFAEMFGYESPEEITNTVTSTGQSFYVHPEVREKIIERIKETGTLLSHEVEFKRKDGSIFYGNLNMRINPGSDTEKPYLEGFVEDITDRVLAEKKLVVQTEAMNAASDMIIIVTKDEIIEYANNSYLARKGYTRDELIGKRISVLNTSKYGNEFYYKVWENILKNKIWKGELTIETKDGEFFLGDTTITPILNDKGEVERGVVIIRDVTEAKAAERRYKSVIENVPAIIYKYNCDDKRLEYNLGKTAESYGLILNNPNEHDKFNIRNFIPNDDDYDRIQAQFIEAAKKDQNYSFSVSIKTKEGRLTHWETVGQSYIDELSGKRVLEGIAFDITERVMQEEQLNQARKLETVGKLAAGIAHDFNNILQAILGYTNVIQIKESKNESTENEIMEIENAALRASDLVKQILAFSRQIPRTIEPVDLRTVAKEVATLISNTIPRTIKIEVIAENRPFIVMADNTQMHQILMNLCINSRDAMPDGGHLTISVDNVVIEKEFISDHKWAKEGNYVRIVVEDTGHGMSPQTLERALDPFFTTKPVNKGTGLGLSTVYGIVKSHDGLMNIESTLGEGTKVSIYLPMADVENVIKHTEMSPIREHVNAKVLVVDDEYAIRQLCKELLQDAGYVVYTAENGTEALDMCDEMKDNLDVIILDLNMPEMTGSDAIEKICEVAPQAKIIVATGYDQGDENISKNIKPYDILLKPFKPNMLLDVVYRAAVAKINSN